MFDKLKFLICVAWEILVLTNRFVLINLTKQCFLLQLFFTTLFFVFYFVLKSARFWLGYFADFVKYCCLKDLTKKYFLLHLFFAVLLFVFHFVVKSARF